MQTSFSVRFVTMFFLSLLGVLIASMMWFFGQNFFQSYSYYQVMVSRSIAGLYKGTRVYYNGIGVGYIKDIQMGEQNKVLLILAIMDKIRLRSNTVATINMKGLTGALLVDLTGGTEQGSFLPQTTVEKLPQIQYQESMVDMFISTAPVLLTGVARFLDKLDLLTNEKNMNSLQETLSNTAKLSKNLADLACHANQFANILSTDAKPALQKIGTELADTVTHTRLTLDQMHNLLQKNSRPLSNIISNLSQTTKTLSTQGLGGLLKTQRML